MIQHSIESRNNKRTELGMPRYHHITRWVLFSSPALRIFPITISFCLGLGFALAQITLDESPENEAGHLPPESSSGEVRSTPPDVPYRVTA